MTTLTESSITYLTYLELPLEEPSYNYLERICHAHLNTFPYENISKLLYFCKNNYTNFEIPSFELFIKNYSEYNFGGTCYTLNSNLMRLLKELGFVCYHIMLGNDHMAIIVNIDNERFYVDCGAAAPLFKPVRFESDCQNISHFGDDKVYLLPGEQENIYKYVRYTNGNQRGKIWYFNARQEVNVSDFNQAVEKSNKPNAQFMSILRCQLYQIDKNRSVSLVNNKFVIHYSSGETIARTLTSPREIKEIISEEFKLPKLPVSEAIDVLRTLDIDIFTESSK